MSRVLGTLTIKRSSKRAKNVGASSQDRELKSTLLDALAHEMKSPLASIKLAVTTLLASHREMDACQRQELLGVIDRNTDRLNTSSTEIIHMASVEAGTLRLKKERQHVGSVVRRIVDKLASDFPGTPIDIRFEDKDCHAEFDAVMIKYVLKQLLDNARKYSPAGSPVVTSYSRKNDSAIITVNDCGPGISRNEQEHIFEKYYRGRVSRRETTGMGLGLAIARSIVRAHGGDLWVVSDPGHGAAFSFSLPSSLKDRRRNS